MRHLKGVRLVPVRDIESHRSKIDDWRFRAAHDYREFCGRLDFELRFMDDIIINYNSKVSSKFHPPLKRPPLIFEVAPWLIKAQLIRCFSEFDRCFRRLNYSYQRAMLVDAKDRTSWDKVGEDWVSARLKGKTFPPALNDFHRLIGYFRLIRNNFAHVNDNFFEFKSDNQNFMKFLYESKFFQLGEGNFYSRNYSPLSTIKENSKSVRGFNSLKLGVMLPYKIFGGHILGEFQQLSKNYVLLSIETVSKEFEAD